MMGAWERLHKCKSMRPKGMKCKFVASQETNIFRRCQVAMTFKCTRFPDTAPEAYLLIQRSKLLEYWTRKTDAACMVRVTRVRELDSVWAVGLTGIKTEDIPVSTYKGMKCRDTGRQPVHAAPARATWKVGNERRREHRRGREDANLGS